MLPVIPPSFVAGGICADERRAVAGAIAAPALVVQAKGHGHAGTAMAIAPLMHVLYQRVLRHDPVRPDWEGRDRLLLSAGHASLALYCQLFLAGYGLELADLAASRSLGALTPGHPELGHTPGVEMSTGPLGQGVASAVGLAIAARRDSALHDTPGGRERLWDPTVYVVAGDGCLQEGVSAEASSLAGSLGLDNLVLIWDDNKITIDNSTDLNFSEDVRGRYRAYGWNVVDVDDPSDLDAIEAALRGAGARDGRPTLVALRTVIAAPAPGLAGTSAAHAGALGADAVDGALTALGYAPSTTLDGLFDDACLAWAHRACERGRDARLAWEARLERWTRERPELADARARTHAVAAGEHALAAIAPLSAGSMVATRKASGQALRALVEAGVLLGGSCDLSESNCVNVSGPPISRYHAAGGFIPFGIREHAMAAIMSGIALHGLWRPYGATYLAFSDYMRPAMRLAALMNLPAIYVFTHDSLAVGEDGSTHQPVEQIAALRTIPGLTVVRPADATEAIAAWQAILDHAGPVALVLSRQNLPVLDEPPTGLARAEGVRRGGYVAWQSGGGRDVAIIATGSEVSLAIEAAKALCDAQIEARVVSMPCVEWFTASSQEWQDAVLPPSLTARVAVEAGRGDAWYRWVGLKGRVVSVERFGESGPGAEVMARAGITIQAVVDAALQMRSNCADDAG